MSLMPVHLCSNQQAHFVITFLLTMCSMLSNQEKRGRLLQERREQEEVVGR